MPPGLPDPKLAYRTAALKALATGGTAARAALDTANASLEASKAESIKQAMAASVGRGASGPVQDALTAIIGAGAGDIGAGLAKKGAAVGTTFDMVTPPWSKVFDSERAAAQAEARGGRGGGGGGGGGRGGSSKEPGTWDWFYDNDLNLEYGSPSAGGLSRWEKAIKGTGLPRGGQLGLAKQMGAPRGIRIGEFGDSPTIKQQIQQGLAYTKLPKSDPKYLSPAQFIKGLQLIQAQGGKGHAATIKKAKQKAKK